LVELLVAAVADKTVEIQAAQVEWSKGEGVACKARYTRQKTRTSAPDLLLLEYLGVESSAAANEKAEPPTPQCEWPC
jgi:hypothetical protein